MDHSCRRVITTHNADGRSVIAEDTRIETGPLGIVDFWKTTAAPASLTEDGIAIFGPNRLWRVW